MDIGHGHNRYGCSIHCYNEILGLLLEISRSSPSIALTRGLVDFHTTMYFLDRWTQGMSNLGSIVGYNMVTDRNMTISSSLVKDPLQFVCISCIHGETMTKSFLYRDPWTLLCMWMKMSYGSGAHQKSSLSRIGLLMRSQFLLYQDLVICFVGAQKICKEFV